MIRKNLGLSELQARALHIFVVENGKVVPTTLFDHVMKSADKLRHRSYDFIRDKMFPTDQSRDTNYYLYRGHAEDAVLLTEMQAKDK